jgi:hypothetical protein
MVDSMSNTVSTIGVSRSDVGLRALKGTSGLLVTGCAVLTRLFSVTF